MAFYIKKTMGRIVVSILNIILLYVEAQLY